MTNPIPAHLLPVTTRISKILSPEELEKILTERMEEGFARVMFGDDQIVVFQHDPAEPEETKELAVSIVRVLNEMDRQYYIHSWGKKYATLFKVTNKEEEECWEKDMAMCT